MKQLERHATTSAHKLELTKTLVPLKFQILVGHCKEAEEIFEILVLKDFTYKNYRFKMLALKIYNLYTVQSNVTSLQRMRKFLVCLHIHGL